MPVLIVYGVPEHMAFSEISKLKKSLKFSVSSVPELHITHSEVSVFFQKDLDQPVTGKEIVIFIDGLYDRTERTPSVKNRLASVVGKEMAEYFPKAFIEVFVRSFNPILGSWTSGCKN